MLCLIKNGSVLYQTIRHAIKKHKLDCAVQILINLYYFKYTLKNIFGLAITYRFIPFTNKTFAIRV